MATRKGAAPVANGDDRGGFKPGDLVTIAGHKPTMVIAAWRDAADDVAGDRAGWLVMWMAYASLRRAVVPAAALRLAEPAAKD
jgi:hypothetical protein